MMDLTIEQSEIIEKIISAKFRTPWQCLEDNGFIELPRRDRFNSQRQFDEEQSLRLDIAAFLCEHWSQPDLF